LIKKVAKENFFKTFLNFPKKNILLILFFLGFGEWLISDVIHFSGGSFGFIILSFGAYFYLRSDKAIFNEPKNLKGWIELIEEDLNYFEEIEKENNLQNKNFSRKNRFDEILHQIKEQRICLISDLDISIYKNFFDKHLKKDNYKLDILKGLPGNIEEKILPDNLYNYEAIFYHLSLPLSAKDFLWINKLPIDSPAWLAISSMESSMKGNNFMEFKSQLPERYKNKIIKFDPNNDRNNEIPISFRRFILNPRKNIEDTKIRLLRKLHVELQEEIDVLRRLKLKDIQNKNQIIIAATVLASPVPSLDVLSMTILNSLMIKEIKNIWGCSWSPEMLNKVSKQIIKTALAQGVIEWSSQTLLSLSKFHGPNWLIAGSIQAISAAYLTRVVSRSLADFMSISKGVSEPSLEFINKNSEKIVQNAFESEKINWKSLISDMQTSFIPKSP
tara:strand:+ start:29157 stop:30488 length:1332 start_codon:yes stop_codon:yes gene_type:complete